jgi:hypothetical protein
MPRNDEPELERLLQLSQAGRDHPARTLWAGQCVFEHGAVLKVLSDDRIAAKRLHREFVCLGLISPPILTSRDGAHSRVQFIYASRIAEAMKAAQRDE